MTPTAESGAEDTPAAQRVPEERLVGRPTVVMLDVDGTLAPIVDEPTNAALRPRTRRLLQALARLYPVVVVSSRVLHVIARCISPR